MNQAGYARSIKRLRRRTGNMRVSSSLSKIPYGGFSPVRLQTGSTGVPPRPSPAGTVLSARPASLRHPLTYTRLLFLSPKRANGYRRGTCVQAALPSSDANLPVQRSLAPQRVQLCRLFPAAFRLRQTPLSPLSRGDDFIHSSRTLLFHKSAAPLAVNCCIHLTMAGQY